MIKKRKERNCRGATKLTGWMHALACCLENIVSTGLLYTRDGPIFEYERGVPKRFRDTLAWAWECDLIRTHSDPSLESCVVTLTQAGIARFITWPMQMILLKLHYGLLEIRWYPYSKTWELPLSVMASQVIGLESRRLIAFNTEFFSLSDGSMLRMYKAYVTPAGINLVNLLGEYFPSRTASVVNKE